LVLNPTATFVGEKGMGVGAFYLMDKTARAPQGIAGHHYLFLNATYGLSPKTDILVFHSRVLGRYEDEHLQMSGLILKQRLSKNLALGIEGQWGNQRGIQVFGALRMPLQKERETEHGEEAERGEEHERASPLNLHLGVFWARWRGEWEGEEFVPYGGLSWQPTKGWLVTAELRARQKSFLKQSWMIAVHRQLNRNWQLTLGLVQSGLSDRPYISLGLGTGIGIVR
jgi:hypothetical protein